MNFKTQVIGLNKFLTAIYGTETRISTLLTNFGFEKQQIELLRDRHLEPIVENIILVIKERLGNDRLFQVISRRFSFDGNPPDTLQTIGENLGVSRERIRQLEHKAIRKCSYKSYLSAFSKRMYEFALNQLSAVIETPTPELVIKKFDELAKIRDAIDIIHSDYEAKRSEILKTVQAELDSLEAEYTPMLQSSLEHIANLETEIKNDVLICGSTIKSSRFKAIYMRGRITWDTKGLAKYAESYPSLLAFRKQGKPSVSIRALRPTHALPNNAAAKGEHTQEKTYKIETMRQEFPKAYERWPSEEDGSLKQKYAAGWTIPDLVKFFQRNEGAIRSRLHKLGLLE